MFKPSIPRPTEDETTDRKAVGRYELGQALDNNKISSERSCEMKRMRFVLGLFTVLLLVIALALPTAVLAEEGAAATEAETSVAEEAAETATPTEAETGPGEAATEGPAEEEAETGPGEQPPEQPPEDPNELPDPGPGEQPPEQPPEDPTIEGLISTVVKIAWTQNSRTPETR
jgi:hypothetical protein